MLSVIVFLALLFGVLAGMWLGLAWAEKNREDER